jgi:hypothetical protein
MYDTSTHTIPYSKHYTKLTPDSSTHPNHTTRIANTSQMQLNVTGWQNSRVAVTNTIMLPSIFSVQDIAAK